MSRAPKACSATGCPNPAERGTNHCPEHKREPCAVPDCSTPMRSTHANYCERHYYRLRRTGRLDVRYPQRESRGICVIEDCGQVDTGPHGYCLTHATRVRRHGDPLTVKTPEVRAYRRGPDSSRWIERPTYHSAHARVRRFRGSASNYPCVDCGTPARQWSYGHADPEQLESRWGSYSLNFEHYSPRCIRCHKAFDLGVRKTRVGSGGQP